MPALKTYSYKRTGELLREDAPYSIRTIERMVHAGDLERIGDRQRRGVSERSIEAYQRGERGIWRDDQKATIRAAHQAAATRELNKMARLQRSTPSEPARDTTSNAGSRQKRQPRGGWPS